ncbi:MAG: 50S ribosomal protein L11 methyltransferase [Candidatus Rokubacteria bacterium]|nr:50S ribosomal protein L11 methyltransferase [Candidatus Rokubacteria bacterium]
MGASPRYWELALTVSDETTEGLTNFLWEAGALGVVEEKRPGGAPALRAFFPETTVPATLTERVAAYVDGLRALGFAPVGRPRVTGLEDTGWADAWRAHFRPRPIGTRFVVAPPWDLPAATDGRVVLVIEPGRAFGTGHHGSTAGCLQAIERLAHPSPPAHALDLGTGSGILAVALARLGVRRVLAVDDDPDAVAAASGNAERNGVATRVECRAADAATLETAAVPVVVANIITAAHRRLAARYARYVSPGGALVLGGILDAEAPDVRSALEACGWRARNAIACEGWTTLVFERPA